MSLPFQTTEQFSLRHNSCHVQFQITSRLPFPSVLDVFLEWLKTDFRVLPNSKLRKLFNPGEGAVLSIIKSTIPSNGSPCQSLTGFMHSQVPLPTQYPERMFSADLTVDFSNSGKISYDVLQFISKYRIFEIGPNLQTPQEKIFVTKFEDCDMIGKQGKQTKSASLEEEKIVEIKMSKPKSSKSSSPREPELEVDQDDDHNIVSTNCQISLGTSDTQVQVFDVEAIFAKENFKEVHLSEMTESMRLLFAELSTSGGSGRSVSLSAHSGKILIEKIDKIDNKINEDLGVLKEENRKLQEEITQLRAENKDLKRQQEENSAKHEEAIQEMNSRFSEMEKIMAEFKQLKELEQLNELKKSRGIKIKKVKIDLCSSPNIKGRKDLQTTESQDGETENQDLSSSVLSLFPVQKKQDNKLLEKIQQGRNSHEKMEVELEAKVKVEVEEQKQTSINLLWERNLEVKVLGKYDSNNKKDQDNAWIIDEEIIDLYLQKCQKEWSQSQDGIFFFTTKKIKPLLGKGSSLIKYTENFQDIKYVLCPIFFQEKDSKIPTWGLLIISNEHGCWAEPPYIIESRYFDSFGGEPKNTTSKVLNFIQNCTKYNTKSKCISFETNMTSKRIIVSAQKKRDSAVWMLMFVQTFLNTYDKKRFLNSKSLTITKDLNVFRQDLFKALISLKL